MKQLIVVRHGDYGHSELTDLGRTQIRALAEKLKPFTNGATVLVLTSPAVRARQSAEIISSTFGVGFEEHDILWSDESRTENLLGTLELVRSRKDGAEVIILVTHYEYVERFPEYIAREELGTELRSRVIGKGQAWVLDCLQKTLTHVS
ncbi:MAG: histidine phosphatase family protein [Parcubacteria group bacterium]|nr:histidine phosphatase family protein [Parcubacteria group bacterium]